jgi:hypothetical protein
LIDVRVAEAQHAIAQFIERLISQCIALAMIVKSVLHAVDLDDQPPSTALKIDDVLSDRRLSAEMKARLPAIHEGVPTE